MFSGPADGNMVDVAFARRLSTPRRRRPWHVQTPSAREPGDLHRCPCQPWRDLVGKAGVADDEHDGEVGPRSGRKAGKPCHERGAAYEKPSSGTNKTFGRTRAAGHGAIGS